MLCDTRALEYSASTGTVPMLWRPVVVCYDLVLAPAREREQWQAVRANGAARCPIIRRTGANS